MTAQWPDGPERLARTPDAMCTSLRTDGEPCEQYRLLFSDPPRCRWHMHPSTRVRHKARVASIKLEAIAEAAGLVQPKDHTEPGHCIARRQDGRQCWAVPPSGQLFCWRHRADRKAMLDALI